MTREQVIERLRLWAARAQWETTQADRPTDMLEWSGQAQVLTGIAEFLAGQGAQLSLQAARVQIISGRQTSLTAWDLARDDERDLALRAGEVAGYDLALSLLKSAGEAWAA
ncbi:MAG TPA: hypothetical protein VIC85_10275 [Ktedonobacterales bacterium]